MANADSCKTATNGKHGMTKSAVFRYMSFRPVISMQSKIRISVTMCGSESEDTSMAKNTGTEKKTDSKSIKKETDIDKSTDKAPQKSKSRPASKVDSAKTTETKKPVGKSSSSKPAPRKAKDDTGNVAESRPAENAKAASATAW